MRGRATWDIYVMGKGRGFCASRVDCRRVSLEIPGLGDSTTICMRVTKVAERTKLVDSYLKCKS